MDPPNITSGSMLPTKQRLAQGKSLPDQSTVASSSRAEATRDSTTTNMPVRKRSIVVQQADMNASRVPVLSSSIQTAARTESANTIPQPGSLEFAPMDIDTDEPMDVDFGVQSMSLEEHQQSTVTQSVFIFPDFVFLMNSSFDQAIICCTCTSSQDLISENHRKVLANNHTRRVGIPHIVPSAN